MQNPVYFIQSVKNFLRAVNFYRAVLSYDYTIKSLPNKKIAKIYIANNNFCNVILKENKGFIPNIFDTMIIFGLQKISKETLSIIENAGGKVLRKSGRFFHIEDTEGNIFMIYQTIKMLHKQPERKKRE